MFSTSAATLTANAAKRKKTVYILSSMHSVVQTDNTTKRKPNTVTLYNTTKCGVDVMDQMVREYTVRRGTRRWPVAVFYNMIDMAALNAHVLYQACTGTQERRVDFLVELARELALLLKMLKCTHFLLLFVISLQESWLSLKSEYILTFSAREPTLFCDLAVPRVFAAVVKLYFCKASVREH